MESGFTMMIVFSDLETEKYLYEYIETKNKVIVFEV